MGTLLRFLQNFSSAVTKKYWALKKEEIVNLKIFVLFRFLKLLNIRGTYSICFKNNIYETDITHVFVKILY